MSEMDFKKFTPVFIFFSLFSGVLLSAPCYGPLMPGKNQWFWGFEVNTLLRRGLERNNGKFRSSQFFLTGSWGLTDWFSLDGKVGYGYIKYNPPGMEEIDYDGDFAGGYGFRIKILEGFNNKFKINAGFQHISVHPRHQHIRGLKRKVVFDDWQISCLLSYVFFEKFIPYLGVKISRGDLIEWLDGDRTRRKSENSELFGLFLGGDFYLSSECWLNLEARFFDEKGASLGITYAF